MLTIVIWHDAIIMPTIASHYISKYILSFFSCHTITIITTTKTEKSNDHFEHELIYKSYKYTVASKCSVFLGLFIFYFCIMHFSWYSLLIFLQTAQNIHAYNPHPAFYVNKLNTHTHAYPQPFYFLWDYLMKKNDNEQMRTFQFQFRQKKMKLRTPARFPSIHHLHLFDII